MTEWDHWLEYLVDDTPVQLVRPGDTDRPTWAAYEEDRYLGTVHNRFDLDGRWHVQSLNERHLSASTMPSAPCAALTAGQPTENMSAGGLAAS